MLMKLEKFQELNKKLTNLDQQAIINRITTDADYAKVYLQNFEPNTDIKKPDLKGTIKILGNYNRTKGKREAYEVKVFDSDKKGTFPQHRLPGCGFCLGQNRWRGFFLPAARPLWPIFL